MPIPLITLNNVCISFGTTPVLDQACLTVHPKQRIGLIGRNGEGKSTLLKVINGELLPDSGEAHILEQTRVAKLGQDNDASPTQSIFDAVASGLGHIGALLSDYQKISSSENITAQQLKQLGQLQQNIDGVDGWNLQAQVNKVLSRLDLQADLSVDSLSGGWRRRVSLARALINQPQILLLDEPTNHLDIHSINWLEKTIHNYQGAIILVSHDRVFLQNTATDIVEIDRGKLYHWPNNYAEYLKRKATLLEQEAHHQSEFDKRLAKEEKWIRQGIKARRTRNEGRVRALKTLREQRSQRQHVKGKVDMSLDHSIKSGKLVIDCNQLCFGYDNHPIVKDFSIRILRQDRIGFIGENGCGKSTLIKLLLKQITPQSGSVEHGTKLQVAYFDQHETTLPEDKSIIDIVAQGSDSVSINGKTKHVISYLSDFLFSPQQARAPIRALSGGERVRVRLAKLFSQPTNLLVMDEPTNDLDIETLELLEELLINYQGTLLLVSHDRQFLDNVVTSTLHFSPNGKINENVGGYSDWLKQHEAKKPLETQQKPIQKLGQKTEQKTSATEKNISKQTSATKKRSYKLQRELDQLPRLISELEQQQNALTTQISEPTFYQQSSQEIEKTMSQMKNVTGQLEQHYQRWEELEAG